MMLTNAPILPAPGKNNKLILETDTSYIWIGACPKFDIAPGHKDKNTFTKLFFKIK